MSFLPYHSSLGLELVFLPRRPRSRWQEWRNKNQAEAACTAFNTALWKHSIVKAYAVIEGAKPQDLFWGKADIFRSVIMSSDLQPHDAWCLEINNAPIPVWRIVKEESPIMAMLEVIYETAAALDLYPYIEQMKKDGTIIQWPTGGGHLHIGLDFWDEGAQYLPKMYHLEKAICLDFCNYPFIRWLFVQWSDNLNSAIPVDLPTANLVTKQLRSRTINRDSVTEWAHARALLCHSIKQRMARTGKPQTPTYEFRFFDMPRNVKELVLQTRFLNHWIVYWKNRVDKLREYCGTIEEREARAEWNKDVKYKLTPNYLRQLKRDMPFAQKEIQKFFERIRLDPTPYLHTWFDRSYRTRMASGTAA